MANSVEVTDDQVGVEIGARIHTLLWRKRVSQSQLADVLGLNQATVSRKLRGRVPLTATELIRIAVYLGVRPGALLEDDSGATNPGNVASLLPRLDSNQQPSGYSYSQVSRHVPHLWLVS